MGILFFENLSKIALFRVSELVNIKLSDAALSNCQITINQGNDKKDRISPFSEGFKEVLGILL